MKKYKDLTPLEIQKLKDSDMLHVIYPNIPVKPTPLDNPDFQKLIDYCNNYLERLAEDKADDDDKHYLYENVLDIIYGDKVWEFINKLNK